MEKYFEFEARGTNLSTEILAGITTFLTILYIVIVNPSMFLAGGMDFGGVYIATIIAMATATMIMGVAANYPIAIAPGLGINAWLVFSVIMGGLPWQDALGAAAVASGLFIILSVTKFREVFINSIPESLKLAMGAGIGMFVAFIGLRNGKIIVSSQSTSVALGSFADPTAYLTVIGIIATLCLMILRVRGAIFLGMIVTAIAAIILGQWQLPTEFFSMPHGLDQTFFQLSFAQIPSLTNVIFVLLLVTLFDTTGTMLGVGRQAGLIKDGKFPNLRSALLADSVGSFVGAFCGTGPTSAFVESGTGVSVGGRTGFTSVVTAILFLPLIFLEPFAHAISSMPAISAPALILTGGLMIESVREINWNDYTESFPAFFTMLLMPLTYNIANGVGLGMILYVILKTVDGQASKVPPLLYVLAILFAGELFFS